MAGATANVSEPRVDHAAPDSRGEAVQWIDQDFVAFHARMRPDKAVCLAFATGERLTFRQLHERANRAVALIHDQVGDVRGKPLAILARNSVDFLVFVVAVYRCGAILHPLNWRLAAPELEFLLQDARPALILYDDEFGPTLQTALQGAPSVPSISVAAFHHGLETIGDSPYAPAAAGPDEPFLLLYTSGTTGKPKGAIITRMNAFFQAFNFASCSDVSCESVLLCDTPMFHTVGLVAVTWTTLQRGAMFAISDRFVPAQTIERLLDEDLGVTHYFGVPQIARTLLDEPGYKPRALNRLTGFFLGGAPSPPELIERMVKDGVRVANGFGMSETGTISHVPRVLEIIAANPASCGQPAPVMQVRIMDEQGRELPDGAAGELCMAGPAVTPGYWRRPEATASAFHDGWFRSGDIGVKDPVTGFIAVLDRSKDMYISGGENVYPAEVEDALLRAPGVKDVAVIGVPDERWGEVGCAFVVPRPDTVLDAEQLIAFCAQYLAPYKRPKHIRFIDAVPRNAAGKALKSVLRERGL